jgi:hypothetical protein
VNTPGGPSPRLKNQKPFTTPGRTKAFFRAAKTEKQFLAGRTEKPFSHRNLKSLSAPEI